MAGGDCGGEISGGSCSGLTSDSAPWKRIASVLSMRCCRQLDTLLGLSRGSGLQTPPLHPPTRLRGGHFVLRRLLIFYYVDLTNIREGDLLTGFAMRILFGLLLTLCVHFQKTYE